MVVPFNVDVCDIIGFSIGTNSAGERNIEKKHRRGGEGRRRVSAGQVRSGYHTVAVLTSR